MGFLVQMKNFELEPGLKKERAIKVLAVGLMSQNISGGWKVKACKKLLDLSGEAQATEKLLGIGEYDESSDASAIYFVADSPLLLWRR